MGSVKPSANHLRGQPEREASLGGRLEGRGTVTLAVFEGARVADR